VHAEGLSGRPLRRSAGDTSTGHTVLAERGRDSNLLRAAIQGKDKWVTRLRAGRPEPPQRQFFNLASDPGETAPQD
jgi:hypothetical protein